MQIAVAERVRVPNFLHAMVVPSAYLTIIPGGQCSVWVVEAGGRDWRHGRVGSARAGSAGVLLAFHPFTRPALAPCHLFVTDPQTSDDALPPELRELVATQKEPIALEMPILEIALPSQPPRGIHVVDNGVLTVDNHVPSNIPVTSDYGSYWRDQFGAHLSGWVHCGQLPVRRVFLGLGGNEAELPTAPFPDVLKFYPECGDVIPVSWHGYVPGPATARLELRVVTDTGSRTVEVSLPPRLTMKPEPDLRTPNTQRRFNEAVNRDHLRVLEIARTPTSAGRDSMPDAASYTHFTDDPHRLTAQHPPGSLDAIWSKDLLHQLRMPWRIATEINRTLRIGGLTLHIAPQAWPIHDRPNDLWRFSDEGLKILFGPDFGFEVLEAEMTEPLALHHLRRDWPYDELPLHPAYGHAYILSRKTADLPPE